MNKIEIRQTRLSFVEIYSILMAGNKDFEPQLSSVVDLSQYAQKLSKHAYFILLEVAQQVSGCIAYYLNEEGRFVYISHYWVSHELQNQHMGSLLLQTLVSLYQDSFSEIRLEVTKTNPAFLFYKNKGFIVIEERERKYLLSLSLG